MKKSPLDYLLFNLQFDEEEQKIKHKVIFLNNVFFFATIVAIGMGIFRLQKSVIMGMIDFVFALIGMALLAYLHRNKKQVELLSTLALILSFILFFSVYLLAPYHSMRLSLFLLLAASAFFLKGRSKGFLWMMFIVVAIIAGNHISYFDTAYSTIDIFSICLYLVGLYFIFNNYEIIQEEQTEHLKNLNTLLEEKIQERTWELQQANLALKKLSATDQLTGLCNRHRLEELFAYEQHQALRYQTHLSIILLDIDFFKAINDSQGHTAGDAILKEIASIMQNSIRKADVAVRWGGEEFLILAPKTSLEQAFILAEKIRQHIKSHCFPGSAKAITASLGVSAYLAGDNLETMIQRADIALYAAKGSGRDKVVSSG